ncbi:UDP-glycosyltransferase UGT5-like [Aphomia sociella]
MNKLIVFCFVHVIYFEAEAAKILGYFPTPSISHQVVFRPLMHELARRGHEVYVITTDPAFPQGETIANLTELDVRDISYSKWTEAISNTKFKTGRRNDVSTQIVALYRTSLLLFDEQIGSDVVQKLLKDETIKFDLIILESYFEPGLVLSHYYNAPIILMSSMLPLFNNIEVIGSSVHPFLYPMGYCGQRVYNLTMWEKIREFYTYYNTLHQIYSEGDYQDKLMKKHFGPDIPHVQELENNIDMLFINVHPIWDMNRPSPPSVVYLGGMHRNPENELPKDLKAYMDSSILGVIYVSFGTNVNPSMLPQDKVQMLIDVLSRLPYDVLWRWDTDVLPNSGKNIKTFKWLPQSDLLRHPKMKLFIMQGGLQSIDEAIAAGVPMIIIPMIGDQWYNMEQCVHHKVGLGLPLDEFTEEKFEDAIGSIINDESYRHNAMKLYSVMSDRPESSLERAVWWTEHVLRHGGGDICGRLPPT